MSDEAQGAAAPPRRTSPLEKYKDTLEPLRKQYDGRIAPFDLGKHGLFVFRYATGQEVRFFVKKTREANKLEDADARAEINDFETIEFAKRVLVFPAEKAKFDIAVQDYWQALPAMLNAINNLSGASVEELGKG